MDTAKIFPNGNSQAVRLPKKYQFKGDEVCIKKMGDVVLLYPQKDRWKRLRDTLDHFSDDFMEARNQPTETDKRDITL